MKIHRSYTQSPNKYRSLNLHLSDIREYKRRLSRLALISILSLLAAAFLAWNVWDASKLTLDNCMEANNKMNLAATEALVAMQARSRELGDILSRQKVDVEKALVAVQDLRVATGVLRGHLYGLGEKAE